MSQTIAVLNAGSSSLKFSILQDVGGQLSLVTGGQIEGLGTKPRFKAKDAAGKTIADTAIGPRGDAFDHVGAFGHLVTWLLEGYGHRYEVEAVGHRVVHGGAEFVAPTLITPRVLDELTGLIPLVPLHQPHNLAAVRAVSALRPELPQVACFDTAFHRGRAQVTERFALPESFYREGVRRWGFHGLSYESVSKALRLAAPGVADGRVIMAHLGSGASLCAMYRGKCVDTTMSFSVLDGLCMGTRCGAIDAGVVLHLLRTMSRDDVESFLYKNCGLLGMSGVSNDVRELLASREPAAAEAIEYFVYRVVREIGSLVAALGGLDAIVFTAGIGENSPYIRQRICEGVQFLGVALDEAANEAGKGEISSHGSGRSVWVIPTDEEGVIASHTLDVVRRLGAVAR